MSEIGEFIIGATVNYVPANVQGVVVGFSGPSDVKVKVGPNLRVFAARDLVVVPSDPAEAFRSGLAALGPREIRDFLLRDRALHLHWAYQFDPVYGLSNARIELKPHQVSVARRVLSKSKPRMVLADEVGLGKTIEAGLILKELRARGVLERLLIIAPASLVSQWERELRSKFNEDCQIYDGAYVKRLRSQEPDRNPWTVHPTVITSLALARREEHSEPIIDAGWDMVIFDEAHHVRLKWESGEEKPVKAYRMAERLAPDVHGLLLLTATPMQLDPYEFYGLVCLVAPGLFRNYREFVRHRQQIRNLNLMLQALESWPMLPPGFDGSLGAQLGRVLEISRAAAESELTSPAGRSRLIGLIQDRHLLSEVLVRNRKSVIGESTRRVPKRIMVEMTDAERTLYDDVSAYIKEVYGRAQGEGNVLLGFVMTTYRKILASSSYALATAMGRRANKLEQELEGLAAAVDAPEDVRTAAELMEDFDEFGAEDLEEELSDMILEIEQSAEARGVDEGRAEALLAEISIVRDLEARARRVKDTKLERLKHALRPLLESSPREKVLIFTQFIETQKYLAEQLKDIGTIALFNGHMNSEEKDKQWRTFKDRANVMIATESGGEGRNFQFAHILVNYDLPWNPMKVEQRIGRLDRIGQTHEVHVYNFSTIDTIEERVLQILEQRIGVFEETIGGLDPILGDIEKDIARLVFSSPEEVALASERLDEVLEWRMQEARRKERELGDFILDRRSFRQDETNELLGRTPEATYGDLERFVTGFLGRYEPEPGREHWVRHEADDHKRITVPRALHRLGLEQEYSGTFSPRQALRDERAQFFAFGHPLVDRLIGEAAGGGLAPSAATMQVVSTSVETFRGFRFVFQVRTEQPSVDSQLFEIWLDESGKERDDLKRLFWAEDVACGPVEGGAPSAESFDPAYDHALELAAERREAARTAAEERWETYVAEERNRVERVHDFKMSKLRSELASREDRLESFQGSDRPEDRRLIPAIEGQVRKTRERMQEAETEFNDSFRDLDSREKRIGADYELLSVASVVL